VHRHSHSSTLVAKGWAPPGASFSGGGFGDRLRPDEVALAVAISKAIGKPVGR